jgi:hypothetical protein
MGAMMNSGFDKLNDHSPSYVRQPVLSSLLESHNSFTYLAVTGSACLAPNL